MILSQGSVLHGLWFWFPDFWRIFVRIALDYCLLLWGWSLQVLGSIESLVPWPSGILTIFSCLPVIQLHSYCQHTIPVSLHHLQFHCSVFVSVVVVWIRRTLPLLHCPLVSHPPVTVCGPRFQDIAWWVCCSCCVGMCTRGATVLMFSRPTFMLSLLNALSASTNSRHSLLSSS